MRAVNPYRGEVLVPLGERKVVLRPTFDAICRMEKATGMGVMVVAQKLCDNSLTLGEMALMIEQCQLPGSEPYFGLEVIGQALVAGGITKTIPVLVQMMEYILSGSHAPAE